MNYSHKNLSKQVFTRGRKLPDNKYTKIKKSELKALLGTDPGDIYNNLFIATKNFPGYFLPAQAYVNDDYLGAIVRGIGAVFKRTEIHVIDPYGHKFHDVTLVAEEVRKYPDILEYFPQRWYRKGPLENCLKMEDRTFIYSIFAKVRPNEYEAWMKQQDAKWELSKQANDPDDIEIATELYDKIKEQNKVYYKTGRSCQIICNQPKNIKRKRALAEDSKFEAMSELLKDKVWQPPANLEEVAEPNLSQDLVLSSEYQKVKKLYLNVNKNGLKLISDAQRIPWVSTKYIGNENERINAYNHLKEQMEKEFNWANIKIPSITEAYNLWNFVNN